LYRYIGNTGKRYRVEDNPHHTASPKTHRASVRTGTAGYAGHAPQTSRHDAPPKHRQETQAGCVSDGTGHSGFLSGLSGIFSSEGLSASLRSLIPALPFGLDVGDLLLILMLFLLYTESGDEDFLIILAVVGFSILKEQ